MSADNVSSIRIGIAGDMHFGGNSNEFGTAKLWAKGTRRMNRLDVDILALAGDLSHEGKVPQLEIAGRVFTKNFEGEVIAVSGNHDLLLLDQSEVECYLNASGINVLEGKAIVREKEDIRIGIIGFNGSVPKEIVKEGQSLPLSARITLYQAVTNDLYIPALRENIAYLEGEGVDGVLVLAHIPLTPKQYSDSTQHECHYEMTPEAEKLIEAMRSKKAMASGHVHSSRRNPAW